MTPARLLIAATLFASLFGAQPAVPTALARPLAADPACVDAFTPIPTIQGTGATTPISGTVVTTQGVVVGDYEGAAPALGGFYLQAETPDADALTSEGLFIDNGVAVSVTVGQRVRVTGTASEFQNQTRLTTVTAVLDCDTASVAPVDLTLPVASSTALERYEGMLVRFLQPLVVTESFQLGRFGQVTLAGARLRTGTDAAAPGAPAQAVIAANALNQIVLDDAENGQNPDPVLYARGGAPLSAANTLRAGDQTSGIVGVLTYGWAGVQSSPFAWRLRPVGALGGSVPVFTAANARPAAPALTGGANLRVVGMNVLNYFNQFSGCTNGVGGAGTACRGANSQTEFDRQSAKIVAAILGLNADVIGLSEIQNNGYGPTSAIQDLVTRLNAAAGAGTYAFVDVDAATGQVNALGIDAIKVGLLYRPARVAVVGQAAALNTGPFGIFTIGSGTSQRNRPALAATFQAVSGGGRLTVSVNHLKSKGSDCDNNIAPVGPDPDIGDGQGNCNLTRTAAAEALVAWLATAPTGVSDGDVLIVGDLNSYRHEDPVTAIKAAGYTDLVDTRIGADAYSYVFDGEWGYLDHALASAGLSAQVAGVGEWHNNADEPTVLDYNVEFKSVGQVSGFYAADVYRASDHDPVYVDLALLGDPAITPTPTASATPTPTATATGTLTPTPTVTIQPTARPWPGKVFLPLISRQEPPPTPTPTATPTRTATTTLTPTATATQIVVVPTATPTWTATPGSGVAALVIDQLSGTSAPEFVIIRNTDGFAQNLTGWKLVSVNGAVDEQMFNFPGGFVLAANATVRIESYTNASNNPPAVLFWNNLANWNNNGDKAELRRPDGVVVDTDCYGNRCP